MGTCADNHPIAYQIARASSHQILEHLRQCASQFDPPLDQRVDLPQYAEKLVSRSVTLEAWCRERLVGLVAAYLNAQAEPPTAFVSSVSVLAAFRSQGIAKRLLHCCHREAKRLGIGTISLEVSPGSAAAVSLYSNLGYVIIAKEATKWSMQLDLGPDE